MSTMYANDNDDRLPNGMREGWNYYSSVPYAMMQHTFGVGSPNLEIHLFNLLSAYGFGTPDYVSVPSDQRGVIAMSLRRTWYKIAVCPASAKFASVTVTFSGKRGDNAFDRFGVGYDSIRYVPTFPHTPRLAATNINSRLSQVFVSAGVPLSAATRELMADVVASQGEPADPSLLPPGTLRASHRNSDGVPLGGNILFLDAHVGWRSIGQMTLRTTDNNHDLSGLHWSEREEGAGIPIYPKVHPAFWY